jgi:hypothetical protein
MKIYKTIIVSVVLHGCENWLLALREEHRFRVFENRVLSRIFRPKRVEMTEEWRRLHTKELHKLYASPNIIMAIKPMVQVNVKAKLSLCFFFKLSTTP